MTIRAVTASDISPTLCDVRSVEQWLDSYLAVMTQAIIVEDKSLVPHLLENLRRIISQKVDPSIVARIDHTFFADWQQLVASDVQAALNRDPAAKSLEEIMLGYSSVRACIIHRVAHALNKLNVPVVPRIMSSYGTRIAGVEIHPGAMIGTGFFLDHGVGTVIGETSVIGQDCTIYHGVTLGLLRLPISANGQVLKGTKRHPTLGDRVTIFANATILGGETVIGNDSVVAAGSLVKRSGSGLLRGPTSLV